MGTLATIGTITAKMVLDPSGFVSGAATIETRAMQLRGKIQQHAVIIAGAAGAALGDFAAQGIADFGRLDTKMREVFTLLPGISQQARDQLTQDSRDFAMQFGISTDEAIGGLYDSLSAGVPKDNVFAFMETAQKAATGGVTSLSSAVGLLSAVTKGYGDTSQAFTQKVSDLAFTTVRLGQTTFPELSASIGKVVPGAAALGIEYESLTAVFATLTGVTGNTAEVATQWKAVQTALIKPTADMAKALDEQGFASGKAAIETLGLQGTLEMLQDAAGGSDETLAKMLGSAESLTAVLQLTGGSAQKLTSNLGEMDKATGATEVAFTEMDSGIEASGRKILAFFNDLKLTVGKELQAFGPLFMAFGPQIGRWMGRGLGGIAGILSAKLAGPAVKGAVKAAGILAGGIYQGAVFVSSKFMAAAIALWGMMGGKRVLAAATAAGAKAGVAYAGASAAGGMLGAISAAVATMAPVAIPVTLALAVGVLASKTDTAQRAAQLEEAARIERSKPGKDFFADLNQGLANAGLPLALFDVHKQVRDNVRDVVEAYDPLSSIGPNIRRHVADIGQAYDVLSSVSVRPPTIAGPIREEFKLASAAVATGFGAIKAALADPPQIISKQDRLANMAKRMKKVMVNIRKATEADDPMAQRYWEKARTKQAGQIDKLKGKTTSSLAGIKSAYRTAGIKVKGTWTEVKNKTVKAAADAADGAITETRRIPTAIDAMDLTGSGTALMNELAAGIDAGIPAVSAAANRAAAAAAAPIKSDSPPKVGPLSDIDKWGPRLMDTWAGPLERHGIARARRAANAVAGAFAPSAGMPALAGGFPGPSGGQGGGGGDTTVVNVGVLIADEAGLDELERRMERRSRRRKRRSS